MVNGPNNQYTQSAIPSTGMRPSIYPNTPSLSVPGLRQALQLILPQAVIDAMGGSGAIQIKPVMFEGKWLLAITPPDIPLQNRDYIDFEILLSETTAPNGQKILVVEFVRFENRDPITQMDVASAEQDFPGLDHALEHFVKGLAIYADRQGYQIGGIPRTSSLRDYYEKLGFRAVDDIPSSVEGQPFMVAAPDEALTAIAALEESRSAGRPRRQSFAPGEVGRPIIAPPLMATNAGAIPVAPQAGAEPNGETLILNNQSPLLELRLQPGQIIPLNQEGVDTYQIQTVALPNGEIIAYLESNTYRQPFILVDGLPQNYGQLFIYRKGNKVILTQLSNFPGMQALLGTMPLHPGQMIGMYNSTGLISAFEISYGGYRYSLIIDGGEVVVRAESPNGGIVELGRIDDRIGPFLATSEGVYFFPLRMDGDGVGTFSPTYQTPFQAEIISSNVPQEVPNQSVEGGVYSELTYFGLNRQQLSQGRDVSWLRIGFDLAGLERQVSANFRNQALSQICAKLKDLCRQCGIRFPVIVLEGDTFAIYKAGDITAETWASLQESINNSDLTRGFQVAAQTTNDSGLTMIESTEVQGAVSRLGLNSSSDIESITYLRPSAAAPTAGLIAGFPIVLDEDVLIVDNFMTEKMKLAWDMAQRLGLAPMSVRVHEQFFELVDVNGEVIDLVSFAQNGGLTPEQIASRTPEQLRAAAEADLRAFHPELFVEPGQNKTIRIGENLLRVANLGGRYIAAYGGTGSGTELTWSPLSPDGEVIFDQGRIAVKLGPNQEILVRTSDTPMVSQPTASAQPTAPAPAQSSLSRFVYESNMEDFLKTPDFKSHAVPVEGHQEISVVVDNATGRIHHYLREGEMISPTEAVVTFRLAEDGTIAEVIFHNPQLNFLKDGFEKMRVDYNNSLNPTTNLAGLPPVAPLALGMPEGFEDLQYRIGNEAAEILAPHLAGQESINVRGLIRALRKFRDTGEITGALAELEMPAEQLEQLRAKLIEVHGDYVRGRIYRFGKIEEAINNNEPMDQETVEANLETLRRIAAQPSLAALIGADRLANLQAKLEARLSTTTETSAPAAPIANPIVAVLMNEYHLTAAQVEQVMRLFAEQGLSEQEFKSKLAEISSDLAANIDQLKAKLNQAIMADLSARAANDPELAARLQEQFRAGGGRMGVGAVVSEIGKECFTEYSQGGIMAALGSNSPILQFLFEPMVEGEFWASMARGQFGALKEFFSTSMPATGAGIVGANLYNMLLNLFGVSRDSNARGVLPQVTAGVLSAMGYSALASGGATSALGKTLSRLLSNPVTQRIFVALSLNTIITDGVAQLLGLADEIELGSRIASQAHPTAYGIISSLPGVGKEYATGLINMFDPDAIYNYEIGLAESSAQAEITGQNVIDALSAMTLLYVARNPIFLNPELYKGQPIIEIAENPELADPAYFSQLIGQYEQALAGQETDLGTVLGEGNGELFDPTPQANPAELAYAMLVGIYQGQDLSAQMPAFRALGMMDEAGNVDYSNQYVREGQILFDERSRHIEQQGLVVEVGGLVNGRMAEALSSIQAVNNEIGAAQATGLAPTIEVNLPHQLLGDSRGNIDETALMNYVFVENEDAIWDISHEQRITYFTVQQIARALAGEAVDIDFSDPTVQAVLKHLQHKIPLTE